MARKPNTPDRTRTPVMIRLLPETLRQLKEAAAEAELPPSTYAARLVRRALRKGEPS